MFSPIVRYTPSHYLLTHEREKPRRLRMIVRFGQLVGPFGTPNVPVKGLVSPGAVDQLLEPRRQLGMPISLGRRVCRQLPHHHLGDLDLEFDREREPPVPLQKADGRIEGIRCIRLAVLLEPFSWAGRSPAQPQLLVNL